MKDKKNVLRKLFLSTLYLSAFTFGGGLCDCHADEEKIRGRVSLDRGR